MHYWHKFILADMTTEYRRATGCLWPNVVVGRVTPVMAMNGRRLLSLLYEE